MKPGSIDIDFFMDFKHNMQVLVPSKRGAHLSKYQEMFSYINDPSRYAVCGEMSNILGKLESDTKEKLIFKSKELALSKAVEVGVANEQVPYLCQFCQHWHLGKNSRIGKDERTFVLPNKSNYLLRDEVIEGSPLDTESAKMAFQSFSIMAFEEFKLDKLASRNKFSINPHRLKLVTINPQYRAVAWALHLPSQDQPLILKIGSNFVFRSRAGDYWGDDIVL